MTRQTHLLGGVAIAFGYLTATGLAEGQLPPFQDQCVAAILAVAGSVFPDIDLSTSRMGRQAPGVSSLIEMLFGHRGMFHAPLFYTAVLLLACWKWPTTVWIWGAFGLGILSHLVLDTLNSKGIPWLWPMKRRFSIVKVKTGGIGEFATAVVVLLLALFMILWYSFLVKTFGKV